MWLYRTSGDEKYPVVFKYQSVENIINEVLENIADDEKIRLEENNKNPVKINSMKFKLLHHILDSFDILFVQGNRWKEHLNSFLIDEEKIHTQNSFNTAANVLSDVIFVVLVLL